MTSGLTSQFPLFFHLSSIIIIAFVLIYCFPAATMAEFHFGQVTQAVNEVPCASGLTEREVYVPIVISITPPIAFLRSNIVVTISVTGNATCK